MVPLLPAGRPPGLPTTPAGLEHPTLASTNPMQPGHQVECAEATYFLPHLPCPLPLFRSVLFLIHTESFNLGLHSNVSPIIIGSSKIPLQVGSVRFHFHFTEEETGSEQLGTGPLAASVRIQAVRASELMCSRCEPVAPTCLLAPLSARNQLPRPGPVAAGRAALQAGAQHPLALTSPLLAGHRPEGPAATMGLAAQWEVTSTGQTLMTLARARLWRP